MKNNNGFTLVEMLVVLLIFSLLLLFGGYSVNALRGTLERDVFFNQLEADLYYVQNYAINRHESVFVQFYPFYDRYTVTSINTKEVLLNRQLPSTIDMMEGSFTSYIITPDGNTNKFGTIKFKRNQTEIRLIFNIGRGRFRIE
ncbi:competence protein ComGD [Heyndrickxia sporothermodurans]|nr:competence protein ComGD [Heyndrickxia sporothermodurans]